MNPPSQRAGGDEEGDGQQQTGLTLRNVDPRYARALGGVSEGALITEVTPGSPAERAGLAAGTVITEINKKPVRNSSEALRALKSAKSGSTVLVRTLNRGADSSPVAQLHALTVP